MTKSFNILSAVFSGIDNFLEAISKVASRSDNGRFSKPGMCFVDVYSFKRFYSLSSVLSKHLVYSWYRPTSLVALA